MKQLRILMLNDTIYPYGGAEVYFHSLQKLLAKNGHEVYIFGASRGMSLRESFFSRWYSFRYFDEVKRIVKVFNPNIVHVHNISRLISPSVLVACSKFNLPIIQTVHDYHYICPKLWMINDKNQVITEHNSFIECLFHHLPKKNLAYSFFKSTKSEYHKLYIKKYINHFICPSKNLAEWYSSKYGAEKVSFLPNFVMTETKSSSKITNYKTILFVGRLSKEKGVSLLIRAFKIVKEKISGVSLVIVGDGDSKHELVELTRALNVMDAVEFIDKLPTASLSSYYNASAVVVVPSIWVENCPMVALEAVMASRPIIGSNFGGITDIVQNNINGYLFERSNTDDLAKKIIKLMLDKKTLSKFSLNQKNISFKYSDEYHFKKIEKIYSQLARHF